METTSNSEAAPLASSRRGLKRLILGSRGKPGKKYPVWFWAAVLVLGIGAWLLPTHLILNTSPSMNTRLFWRGAVPPVDQVRKNMIFTFRKDFPWKDHYQSAFMIKRVACLPGEILSRDGLNFYCDGTWLGEAITEDSTGRKLNVMDFSGPIPPGKYFMMATHERSYDSKYYGLVGYEEFQLRAFPLL